MFYEFLSIVRFIPAGFSWKFDHFAYVKFTKDLLGIFVEIFKGTYEVIGYLTRITECRYGPPMLVHKINISFANMMQEFCEREFYTRVIDFFVFMQSRQRNIIWYNPLFPQNVQTNVGKSFLRTVKRSFPPGHPLHKIFNQNTLKLSYSCMPNVRNIIDNHNKKTPAKRKER